MSITFTLRDLLFVIIGIGIIFIVYYLVSLFKHAIISLKSINKILQDSEVVSGIAAERSKDLNKIVGEVSESVGTVSNIIKGNQSSVSALTSIINSLTALKDLFSKQKKSRKNI